MPRYTYKSDSGKTVEKLVSYKDRQDSIELDGETYYLQAPTSFGSITMEMKDSSRGKLVRKDMEKQLKVRSKKFHDKYELPDKIDKHGENDAKRHKWDKTVKRT